MSQRANLSPQTPSLISGCVPVLRHRTLALVALVLREVFKWLRQPGRLGAALVRPLLWYVAFAAGFYNVFGVAIIPPYDTYIEYKVYLLPGLLGMIALFAGMQSALTLVYDREMGLMRWLLTAPLPRSWVLACKLTAAAVLALVQMVIFFAFAAAMGSGYGMAAVAQALPAMLVSALMLTALGLALSVYVRQLENFAGTMNFVIFPLFFFISAL